MHSHVEAICFDVGGTLRAPVKVEGENLAHVRQLQALLGEIGDPLAFQARIRRGEKSYRRWCKRSLVELDEPSLWTRFLLPEYPADFIRQNALRINRIWRSGRHTRILPDAVATITELAARGYQLAIISNTTGSNEAPELLDANGLSGYFSAVFLSNVFGRRKPHPALFLAAARALGVAPQHCAYVGDNLARDLVGARQAGFGEVTIIHASGYEEDEFDPDDDLQAETITEMQPDHRITRLGELLDFYPPRLIDAAPVSLQPQPERLYEIAISTSWAADQSCSLDEAFLQARRLGVLRVELNNKITPSLYQQWDKNRFYVATIHDPCPSEDDYNQLRQKDINITSLDEGKRRAAMDALKRSINLAVRLGARSVVAHCGMVAGMDHSLDARLRALYRQGLRASPQFTDLAADLAAERAAHAGAYVERAYKSLEEIVAFARGAGVDVGLENRYRYFDIPLPDELGLFLSLCSESWWGFQYDVGHAISLDQLGFVPHHEWIRRFRERMVGAHLHDVRGIDDHQAPGCGEVDFKLIAGYLNETALRTLEIDPRFTPQQIAAGLEVLADSGCIQRL